MTPLVIYGAGGHAKVLIDIAECVSKYKILGVVADNSDVNEVMGYPVIGTGAEILEIFKTQKNLEVAVGIGDNAIRVKKSQWLRGQGIALATLVHPSAQVARQVTLGSGVVVIAGAVIKPDTIIGNDVILNTLTAIGHDCTIGDGVHVGPSSTLCGYITIGDNVFIGAGTTVIPQINISENAIVGAGSTVIRNVEAGQKVVGSPARPI